MKHILLTILLVFVVSMVHCQMVLSTSSQVNTKCNSSDCNYDGSPILINEIMLSPSNYDGSLIGNDQLRQGEWIELYNPDLCNPVDISCFYIGNNAADNITTGNFENYGGGFILPAGSIVPPGGFAIIRGVNAPGVASGLLAQNGGSTIQITIDWNRSCIGGGDRFWLPNAGGWFALYDRNGVPVDAIQWNDVFNACTSCPPCIPGGSGCNTVPALVPYDLIPDSAKNYITSFNPQNYLGESLSRIPDGGVWMSIPDEDTYGTCNEQPCNVVPAPCDGVAAVTVTGGVPPYTYLWNDIRSQTTATATQLCTGIYCVTVSDANSNTSTACVEVFDFKPVVNLNPFPGVCEMTYPFILTGGTPVDQNSGDLGQYSGNGVSNNYFIPSNAGLGVSNITYTYTDENGCFNSDTSSITVNPRPVPNISGELSLCTGHSSVLDAGPGFSVYQWSTSANSQTITVSVAGIYWVTVTNVFGCTATDVVNVSASSSPPVITGTFEFCSGDSSVIDAGNGYALYEWSTSETTQSIIVTSSGLYSVTVTNSIGCSTTSSANVLVNLNPDANFTSDKINGCEPLTVSFSPMNPQPDVSYNWNFLNELTNEISNEMYPVHTFPTEGVYDVNLVATSNDGCTSSSYHPQMITVFKEPDAEFAYNPPFASLVDPEIFFTNQSHFADNYVWIFGDGGFSYDLHPSHSYNHIGDFIVQLIVTTHNGCVDTATSLVVVDEFTFYAPTAFSPDNLLCNNVFYVTGNGISSEDFSMYIFDRWGQILFETQLYSPDNPAQFGWNGSFRSGEKVPVGSYTWLVYYKDGRNNTHERTGVVHVIR